MRQFVISDIHGNNELFQKALDHIALEKSDALFLLGDLIDRGPDTKGVLDSVIDLKEKGYDIRLIKGNHEALFLAALDHPKNIMNWMLNGGDRMLFSFKTGHIHHIPGKYIELINNATYYAEVDNYILVHAALNMQIDDPFSDQHTLLWHRKPYELLNSEWLDGRTLVHGHTPMSQEDIQANLQAPIICIDNATYLNDKPGYGSLPVLELTKKKLTFIK